MATSRIGGKLRLSRRWIRPGTIACGTILAQRQSKKRLILMDAAYGDQFIVVCHRQPHQADAPPPESARHQSKPCRCYRETLNPPKRA